MSQCLEHTIKTPALVSSLPTRANNQTSTQISISAFERSQISASQKTTEWMNKIVFGVDDIVHLRRRVGLFWNLPLKLDT